MTGADLSNASRRADGLATSAVLDTETPTSLGKACELSPARNPDAAMLRQDNPPLRAARGTRASVATLAGGARTPIRDKRGMTPFN